MSRIKSQLSYYKQSLIDAARKDISSKQVQEKAIRVTSLDQLTNAETDKIIARFRPDKDSEIAFFSIAPFAIRSRANSSVVIYPYWIPAALNTYGKLLPPKRDTEVPWIVRGVLEPNDHFGKEYPTLCTVAHENERSANALIQRSNWEEYWESCAAYFFDLTGFTYTSIKIEGWNTFSDNYYLFSAERNSAGTGLIETYSSLEESDESTHSPALTALLRDAKDKRTTVQNDLAILVQDGHYGQMGNSFPLSPSQRVSIQLFEQPETDGVLAVNGPPGTGKTTLLQSICANMVVQKVVKEQRAPLILGASSNNQAVTNILDSFSSVVPKKPMASGLDKRWIPNISALGMYLASNTKALEGKEKGYLAIESNKDGINAYREYITQNSPQRCARHFLSAWQHYTKKKTTDISTAVEDLLLKTQDLHHSIRTLMHAARTIIEAFENQSAVLSNIQAPIEDLQRRLSIITLLQNTLNDARAVFHIPIAPVGIAGRIRARIQHGPAAQRLQAIQNHLNCQTNAPLFPDIKSFSIFCQKFNEKTHELLREHNALSNELSEVTKAVELIVQYISEKTVDGKGWADTLFEQLDQRLRYQAFWTALHYLEGKWIIDRMKGSDKQFNKLNKGKPDTRLRYEIMAGFTPCFVSTMYSADKFFKYSSKLPNEQWVSTPMGGLLDLIIIDEAGQVTPEVGIPAFNLAQKALVVGDTKQIEPIWGITSEKIDASNARLTGLAKNNQEYQALIHSHKSSMNSSLMHLAQHASTFLYPASSDVSGTMLREHRRCSPPIAEFCNQFVYNSLLEVMTKGERKLHLPALGYCHIPGECFKANGSRHNPAEAESIAWWLQHNQQELCRAYNTNDIGNIVGIVTPFSQQKRSIIEALEDNNIDTQNLVVGTVHALQGAERPIILFSSAYGSGDVGSALFFDQNHNMLNVAVSRAKHHFLVFGYMPLFSPNRQPLPSGNLGSLLFADPENEISNDFLYDKKGRELEQSLQEDTSKERVVTRIADLDHHRKALSYAFAEAKKRLVIVSPFISVRAIQADNLAEIIAQKTQEGLEVLVLTDEHLDCPNGNLKPHAQEGRQLLQQAGAQVVVRSGIHNKTLILDDQVIIEGSFNWLSAVRDPKSPYARDEKSIAVRPDYSFEMISTAIKELELSPI